MLPPFNNNFQKYKLTKLYLQQLKELYFTYISYGQEAFIKEQQYPEEQECHTKTCQAHTDLWNS